MPKKGKSKIGKKKKKVTIKLMEKLPKPKPRSSPAVKVGASLGSIIGGAIGGAPGMALGSVLGGGAGALFKKITGFGDYKIVSNTLSEPLRTDSLPSFTKSGRGMRVVHREYLGDVITSPVAGGFKIAQYPIQPALASVFSWLGPVAGQFDEYQVLGMVFEFKSNSYDALASTNTASGTVIMTTQYNVLAPPFTNKLQMEQYEFTCSAKPSVDIMHPVECARGESPTYTLTTRTSVAPGDLRLYDLGTFNLATVGMQGTNVNVGELWVSYDINLLKPRINPSLGLFDHYIGDPATVADAKLLGNFYVQSRGSNLGSDVVNSPGSILNFPTNFNGTVEIQYRALIDGASTPGMPNPGVNPTSSWTINTPLSVTLLLAPQPVFSQIISTGGVSQWLLSSAFYQISGGGSISIAGNGLTAVTVDAVELLVITVPPSID